MYDDSTALRLVEVDAGEVVKDDDCDTVVLD